MTRDELIHELEAVLHFRAFGTGTWIATTVLPGTGSNAPVALVVRLLKIPQRRGAGDDQDRPAIPETVATMVHLGLKTNPVESGELLYEYMIEANTKKSLGALAITDGGEIIVTAELPCGQEPSAYFSKKELAVMLGAVTGIAREHYRKLVELVQAAGTSWPF